MAPVRLAVTGAGWLLDAPWPLEISVLEAFRMRLTAGSTPAGGGQRCGEGACAMSTSVPWAGAPAHSGAVVWRWVFYPSRAAPTFGRSSRRWFRRGLAVAACDLFGAPGGRTASAAWGAQRQSLSSSIASCVRVLATPVAPPLAVSQRAVCACLLVAPGSIAG
jgi:hypothetical protein